MLQVDTVPKVTANPHSQLVPVGGTATFTAAASNGNPTPTTVLWEVSSGGSGGPFSPLADGGVYSGTATTTLKVTGATSALAGDYYKALFSNSGTGSHLLTASTTAAQLSVGAVPVVTSSPTRQEVNSGGTATFSATATPGSPAATTTRWQISTNGGSTWTNLNNGGVYGGVTTATLTVTGVSSALNNDRYRANFSNAALVQHREHGRPCSQVDTAPTVIGSLSDTTVSLNGTATFTASVSDGNPTPTTVRWEVSSSGPGGPFTALSNNGVYSGVTTDTLTITSAPQSLGGDYYEAIVSNSARARTG